MSRDRIEMDRLQELVRLHRMGTSCREVARLLVMSPNTERLYRETLIAMEMLDGSPKELPSLEVLRAAVKEHLGHQPPPQQTTSLTEWVQEIEELFKKGVTPKAIYDRLKQRHKSEFKGSYWSVKRLCRQLRKARGVTAKEVVIRVQTAPGQVAQVDFGYVGRLYDPQEKRLRKAWAFVMVLGYSRDMFVKVVFDQRSATWLQLHVEAFAAFGGVIDTVVPDNLKAAVIRAAFGVGEDRSLHRSYRELAQHYGFKIDPAPPFDPRKKGKVESGVKFVKSNFFKGRDGENVVDVQRELDAWVDDIAGLRIHGTTGRQPRKVFEKEELATLKPLPSQPFETVVWKKATVHKDTCVPFERRFYSVPWRHIGREVWLRATPASVTIYWEDTRVATHERHGLTPWSIIEEHLPEGRRDLRHRDPEYWKQRADVMSLDVGAYIREVLDSDEVLSKLRVVQAMVMHLEDFPLPRAEAACRRAQFYGSHSYASLKNILNRGLDLQPLPNTMPMAAGTLHRPRFARDLTELLAQPLEKYDEPN